MELRELVADSCDALVRVDCSRPVEGNYRPGIGPHTEAHAVELAVNDLKQTKAHTYADAAPRSYPGKKRQTCDLVIPDEWAVEFKLARPFGDNGKQAEHWIENVLYPYAGNQGAIGDCLKLRESGFKENLGVVIFGFEHAEPQIALETAIKCFELVSREVLHLHISQRVEALGESLCHPIHQRLRVYGWQLFRT